MRRHVRLTLELGACQPQRFDLPDPFRIDRRLRGVAATTFGLTFFDLLLDARFGVDQAFSGITHLSIVADYGFVFKKF